MLLFMAAASPARAQSMLSGTVLTTDSVYVVAAHVMLHDSTGALKSEALTDEFGDFSFRVRAAQPVTLYITIIRIGFTSVERAPIRVGRSEAVTVRILMNADAVVLAPVTVVARKRNHSRTLDDYYDKLAGVRRGLGHVIDRTALDKYGGQELLPALLRVPGVQYGTGASPVGTSRRLPRMRGGCIPLTFLDRLPVPEETFAELDPASLEGVLVYVGGMVPPEFSQLTPGVPCGVMLAYSADTQHRRRTNMSRWMTIAVIAAFAAVSFVPW